MIHYFPLERLQTRYTAHLDDSIVGYLTERGLDYYRYYPELEGDLEPPTGQFLNAATTSQFKAEQIADYACNHRDGLVHDGDTLFFADLWFPGIETVRYLDHFTGTQVEIRGIVHAGSFTDHDLITGIERWAAPFETIVFDLCDRIYCGSNDLADDVARKRLIDRRKLYVTPLPLDPALKQVPRLKKDPVVVFNGRLSPEKQPQLAEELADAIDGAAEVVTAAEWNLTRQEYYRLLARSRVVVSFALEETFGFAIKEAAALGCVPVVPNRLCYPEQYPARYRYDDWYGCVDLVQQALAGLLPPLQIDDNADSVAAWFKDAA